MFKTMLETCLLYLSNHINFCNFCPAKIGVQLMVSCSGALAHKTADLNKLKHIFTLNQ